MGARLKMSLSHNQTAQLWGRFAPQIKNIPNRVNDDKISMQLYGPAYYENFHPDNEFEKWASVEVNDFSNIPEEMESFVLKPGLYAVFDYKGSSADPAVFQYIFWQWLPQSPYHIDDRPHFEVLGKNYRNNDPNSEEEIWIPVREKDAGKGN